MCVYLFAIPGEARVAFVHWRWVAPQEDTMKDTTAVLLDLDHDIARHRRDEFAVHIALGVAIGADADPKLVERFRKANDEAERLRLIIQGRR